MRSITLSAESILGCASLRFDPPYGKWSEADAS